MKESIPAGSEFAIEVCDTRGVRVVILALLYYFFRIIVVDGETAEVGGRKQDEWLEEPTRVVSTQPLRRLLLQLHNSRILLSYIFAILPQTRFVLFGATPRALRTALRTLRLPLFCTRQTATTSVMDSNSPYYVDPWSDSPHYAHAGTNAAGTNFTNTGE